MGKVKLVAVQAPGDAASLRELDDDELMTLVRAGLAAALRTLAERHMEDLKRFCGKLLTDFHAGQEIAQQAWLQIWAHRARYESHGRFKVFLYTIARNMCKNELRRRSRLGSWTDPTAGDARLASVPSDDATHLDALLLFERKRELLRALAKVPESQREAMLLRFDEELSYQEMAAVLGAAESTLRSRVHHGLRALRAAMTRDS
jgi:RNA polymerase sigma-70 factor (ECF subfamily)